MKVENHLGYKLPSACSDLLQDLCQYLRRDGSWLRDTWPTIPYLPVYPAHSGQSKTTGGCHDAQESVYTFRSERKMAG